MTLNSNFFKK